MKSLNRAWKKSKFDVILNFLIILFCIQSIFPIYWLLTSAFKYSGNINKIPPDWFPKSWTLNNFDAILSSRPVGKWLFNSFGISIITTALIIFVSCLTAFAISKLKFKGKKILFGFIIAALVLPKEVYLLPLYKLIVKFGWQGKWIGFIIPDVAMPFGVFLMKQFYDGIPDEILEAASIDGCGKFRFFIQFALPLSKSGIAALGILSFIKVWNGYLWQMCMAKGELTYTIPVGIASLFSDPSFMDYGLKFAGATLTAVPLLIVFIIFQKYFTSGVTAGSVKG